MEASVHEEIYEIFNSIITDNDPIKILLEKVDFIRNYLKIDSITFVPFSAAEGIYYVSDTNHSILDDAQINATRDYIKNNTDIFSSISILNNVFLPSLKKDSTGITVGSSYRVIGLVLLHGCDADCVKILETLISLTTAVVTIIENKSKLKDLHVVNQKLYQQYIKNNNEEESDFERLLNSSTQVIDDLILGISHGVNNPLAILVSSNSLFKSLIELYNRQSNTQDERDALQQEMINIINEQNLALSRISSTINDLNSMIFPTDEITNQSTNLHAGIMDGISLAQLPYETIKKMDVYIHPNIMVKTSRFSIAQPTFHVMKYLSDSLPDISRSLIKITAETKTINQVSYVNIKFRVNQVLITPIFQEMSLAIASRLIQKLDGDLQTELDKDVLTISLSLKKEWFMINLSEIENRTSI